MEIELTELKEKLKRSNVEISKLKSQLIKEKELVATTSKQYIMNKVKSDIITSRISCHKKVDIIYMNRTILLLKN